MRTIKLFVASLLCLSSVHSLSGTPDLGGQVFQVFYDKEMVGTSERIVRRDAQKRWLVESNHLLFESFFGDNLVLGLTLESYGADEHLQSAHYLSLYDGYLLSSTLKPHGEAAFIQSLMVYELSDEQETQALKNWSIYSKETAQAAELSSALKAFLFRLKITESYSTTIERSKFDYTVAQVSYQLPTLLSKASPLQVRLFDPDSEGSPFVTMYFELDKAVSDASVLQIKATAPGGQESYYQYTFDKTDAVLSKMINVQDGEIFELRLMSLGDGGIIF